MTPKKDRNNDFFIGCAVILVMYLTLIVFYKRYEKAWTLCHKHSQAGTDEYCEEVLR